MRIQETDEILKEAKLRQKDAHRHEEENHGMKRSFGNLMRDRRVQAGLGALGAIAAGIGIAVASRPKKRRFFKF